MAVYANAGSVSHVAVHVGREMSWWLCLWHGVRTHQHAFHFSASILPYLAARCVRTAARLTSGAMALTLSVTDGTHKHVASPHKMFRRPLLCLRFTPVLPSACKNHFTKSYYTGLATRRCYNIHALLHDASVYISTGKPSTYPFECITVLYKGSVFSSFHYSYEVAYPSSKNRREENSNTTWQGNWYQGTIVIRLMCTCWCNYREINERPLKKQSCTDTEKPQFRLKQFHRLYRQSTTLQCRSKHRYLLTASQHCHLAFEYLRGLWSTCLIIFTHSSY